MNHQESADGTSSDVLYANFNQDCTLLSVGSKNVFRLYSLEKTDELVFTHGIVDAGVRIIEGYFRTCIAAVVTVSAPWILKILHIKKESEVRRYSYPNTILSVKINTSRLVVCLGESLYIQSLLAGTVDHIISDTPPNPLGLCVLSQNIQKNFLAYPGSSSNGEVKIYDTFNNCSMGMIAAHENPLAAMAFNWTGTKIATASDMDTVIRVFDVIKKTKLYEFRRDDPRCARIYSLCFSRDSNYLSSSSNTETVNIFRLHNTREKASVPRRLPAPVPFCLSRIPFNFRISSIFSILKEDVAKEDIAKEVTAKEDTVYEDKAFATVRLPFSGIRNICALAMIEESLRVLIVSGQRILYIYNVDSVNGGECVLEHTYDLLESGNSVPEDKPLRFICVEGRTQHQKAPADTNPAEE